MNGGFDGGPLNIDLHTHSNCSDGSLTPTDLVARAAAAGVEVLALTDHDTVAGLEEAGHSAGVHGLRLVPGVEISASWRAQAIHVLGLWIDPASAELRGVLLTQAIHTLDLFLSLAGPVAEVAAFAGDRKSVV